MRPEKAELEKALVAEHQATERVESPHIVAGKALARQIQARIDAMREAKK